MDKNSYKKITFNEACNLLTNKGGPITIYVYQAYTTPPIFSEFDITGCSDDEIITGSSRITRYGWNNFLENEDKKAKTYGSGHYIKYMKEQEENLSTTDQIEEFKNFIKQMPRHQLLLDPSPFKMDKQVVSPKDTDTTTNPMHQPGGKVRTRKNRKSRKNKYKKNKSRRKYNKKRHHK